MPMFPRLICVLVISLLAGGCKFSLPDDGPGPEHFRTPVAEAIDNGITPYWLGRSITTGSGIWGAIDADYPRGVVGVSLDAVELRYVSADDYAGSVDVSTIPAAEWGLVSDRVVSQPGATVTTVEIDGNQAQLVTVPSQTRRVHYRYLILRAGDWVVLVSTATVFAKGGAEANPLMDEAAFLAVMEQLRPYPE